MFWHIWWLPYGLAVRHRSWISHCPGVGTALRCGWVALPFLLAAWTLEALGAPIPSVGEGPTRTAALMFCGLCVADSAHLAADCLWSALAKKRRRK